MVIEVWTCTGVWKVALAVVVAWATPATPRTASTSATIAVFFNMFFETGFWEGDYQSLREPAADTFRTGTAPLASRSLHERLMGLVLRCGYVCIGSIYGAFVGSQEFRKFSSSESSIRMSSLVRL